ncbi:hypothetical protein GOP47_0012832 [Adiantum capillus-veneris]|uniref:NADH-ubiquinone reductase complex 1 MLRQ subunit n=1 Tax=Adiantum capillus-veneris TaxID=13818 RepID=A0A9D4URM7_ADICA|nr:hypothetical protein GOP47_0012832 [Adiantum capillus-veneris]
MSPGAGSRWIKPEIWPLFAAVGTAVGLCGFTMFRSITAHPDVRVNKGDRAAGYLENFEEGEQFKEHAFRRFLSDKHPEIFHTINKIFSERE